ncbi:MAG: LPS assembly protein LptD [Rhodospirillaceae bacterium]|nr:LPS assembly protein LptD [Rhodospirillaceae bacterium]
MSRRILLANLVGLFAIALILVQASMVMAQITAANKKPVLITADSLQYDQKRNEVVASGNVQITQGNRTVRADKVIYNQRARRITALGNVVIVEPSGETIFGERMELTEDLHDGLIERFRLLFPDKTRVAANGARRTGGRRTEMAQVVFSPCKLCESDPASAPLWRIKARRVIHDRKTRDVEYRNAWLEVYGVPVAYTPYMAHPDPTVYSRSGFLAPRVGGDSRLGIWIKTPYYWRISRDRDATITPMITTRDWPAMLVEYRERFKNGAAVVDGSYVNTRRRDFQAQRIIDAGSRGHLSGEVRYDISKNWRFGANGLWTTDNTYLQRYKISNDQTLQSNAWLEGFHERDHTILSLHHFQGLREDDRYRETPQALPYVEHERFGMPYRDWGRWHFHFSSASLTRWEGPDSYRASTQLGWRLPYIHKSTGMKFLASVNLFADGYYVTEVGRHSASRHNGFEGRLYPVAKLGWRYPFVREMGNVRVIVKPRAALIASTSGLNSSKIPNEDSDGFEFDEINLFSINRYPGRDRVDDGTRFVYGVNTIFLGNRGGQSEIFLGQSYQLAGDETFGSGSGLDRKLSDIVGQIQINPGRYFNLVYKFRFDAKDQQMPRTEVTTFAGVPALNTSLSYLLFRRNMNSSEFPTREEIAFAVRSQVTRTWSIFGGSRHNLASDGGILKWQAGGQFKNECCTLQATISRSFTYDREIKPSTNFLILLTLKHLGSFGY